MQSTPFYLSDSFMPFYKTVLILAFMLSISSVFVAVAYALFTSSLIAGAILLVKGLALGASLSLFGFLAFWKKHHIQFENCKSTQGYNCNELGYFNFA